jgi:hypothetical protein
MLSAKRNAAAAIHPIAFLNTMKILLWAHLHMVDAFHPRPQPFLLIVGDYGKRFHPLARVGKLIAWKSRELPSAKIFCAVGQSKKRIRPYDTKRGLHMCAIDFKQDMSTIEKGSVSLCDLVVRADIAGINDLYHRLGDDKFLQELLTPNHAELTPLALAMTRGDVATISHLLSLGKSSRRQGRSFSML